MNGLKRAGLGLVIVAAFVMGYGLSGTSSSVGAAGRSQRGDAVLDPFLETLEMIRERYVEPVDDAVLIEGALSGMLDTLEDPFSFYMDAETYRLMNNDLQGRFEGIGATVRQDVDTGRLVIVSTMPGSPAEQAGMLGGDAIAAVDGTDVTALPQGEIIRLIRGPEGTDVTLGVFRAGMAEMLDFVVTRAEIQVPSVESELLEDGIAYVRLYQFGADSTRELRAELLSLESETLPGLILDLRGNPGGYLSTAVEVASEFLETGVVVIERLRNDETIYEAQGAASAPTVPLVILVDEASASASELVAGALQDQGRATIIGVQTFGKGSVQTWRELSNGGGVRVTTARWYTPEGRTIDAVGLAPDIVIELDADDPTRDTQREAALEFLVNQAAAVRP